jgi:hypothetical protein
LLKKVRSCKVESWCKIIILIPQIRGWTAAISSLYLLGVCVSLVVSMRLITVNAAALNTGVAKCRLEKQLSTPAPMYL